MGKDKASEAAAYLNRTLNALGLRDQAAADLVNTTFPNEVQPLNPSVINKWRNGKALPTIPRLRLLIRAIQPRAEMMRMHISLIDVFLRFGLLEAGDLDQEEIPTVYRNAIDVDRQLPDDLQAQMRTHVELVANGMLAKIRPEQPATPRRKASGE